MMPRDAAGSDSMVGQLCRPGCSGCPWAAAVCSAVTQFKCSDARERELLCWGRLCLNVVLLRPTVNLHLRIWSSMSGSVRAIRQGRYFYGLRASRGSCACYAAVRANSG